MTDRPAPASHFASHDQQDHAVALGTWLFLAGELLLFGALFLGYTTQRWQSPETFTAASQHLYRWLAAGNTAILLTSSLLVALAVEAADRQRRRAASRWLRGAAALGLAFLAIKAIEYGLDARDGLIPGLDFDRARFDDPGAALRFYWLYVVMTGLHALHVLIGAALLALGSLPRVVAAPQRVRAIGLFWHLVDLIWVFLFPLFYLV